MPPEVAGAVRVFGWPMSAAGADGSPCMVVTEVAG
jgi:hypothetical protein